jgi:hypothetical protein
MADPENQTLRLLREMRKEANEFDARFDRFEQKTDANFTSLHERLQSLQQAMIGESVLGRYTVAEVE